MLGPGLALVLIVGLLSGAGAGAAIDPRALLFRVRAIELVGLGPGTLDEDEILALEVELSPSSGGWIAAGSGLGTARLRLEGIGGADGRGTRLFGSAVQAIVDAIGRAHRERDLEVRADVRVGTLDRLRSGGDGRLVIELSDAARGRASQPVPHAPVRFGRDAVLVTVRTVSFAGHSELRVDENDLLALHVNLSWDASRIPPGYVAPRRSLPVQAVPLWKLGGWEAGGAQLYGSALDQILTDVRDHLARSGKRARVRLNPSALRRLATPGSDGLLLLDLERP